MDNVPAWLGFTIGSLGALLGVLLSQRFTSTRDQKRRELDKQIETAKLRAGHESAWRDTKVRAYGLFLGKLKAAESMLEMMRTSADFEEVYMQYRAHVFTFSEHIGEIELICSGNIGKFLQDKENRATMELLAMPPNLANVAQTGDVNDPNVKRLERLLAMIHQYRKGFLVAARQELGVVAPKLTD